MNEPTIYVIDDESAVRDSLMALLNASGHRVETFASAADFLDAYDQAMQGCVLLDVRMPGMNGFALLERLVRDGSTLPVILISGHGDDSFFERALGMGAMGFIQKPFREEVLLAAINRCLGSRWATAADDPSSEPAATRQRSDPSAPL